MEASHLPPGIPNLSSKLSAMSAVVGVSLASLAELLQEEMPPRAQCQAH